MRLRKKVVPSEAEIAANDDILYVANCGTADPTDDTFGYEVGTLSV
mgnify:CR=1 FL=1